ncbi:MAG: peptidase M20, partial [Kordiimonadaceae bacterium]|nr:peptidase M20 [Kordiimonadaceae bacterium]
MKYILMMMTAFGVLISQATADEVTDAVKSYRLANEKNIITEYMTLLEMPNVPSVPSDMEKNAAHISAMMERRGIDTMLLEYPDVPPVIYGEYNTLGATKTLMFYAHYDGQ